MSPSSPIPGHNKEKVNQNVFKMMVKFEYWSFFFNILLL